MLCAGQVVSAQRPTEGTPGPIWSHSCEVDDLLAPYELSDQAASELEFGEDWTRRWVTTWKTSEGDLVCPVRALAGIPTLLSVPVRRFSWRASQQHRPGLDYMVSTGRQHGFESLAEHKLLLALDFAGGVREVLSQPFRLRFTSVAGPGEHIPDFLALMDGTAWLLDVKPAGRIKAKDALRFAATARAAGAAGWRYSVVTAWRRQVMANIDTFSAQRRPLVDRLGLQSLLLGSIRDQPLRFGDLVEATPVPAVARAHAIHLLWRRCLAMDLRRSLGDGTWIYGTGGR